MYRYIRSSEGSSYTYQYKGMPIHVREDGTHYIYTQPHGQGYMEFDNEKDARETVESMLKKGQKVYSAEDAEEVPAEETVSDEDIPADEPEPTETTEQDTLVARTRNLAKQFITFTFLKEKDKIDVAPEECAIRSYNQLADFIQNGKLQEDDEYINFLKTHKNYLKSVFEQSASLDFEYEDDAVPEYNDNW